MFVERLCGTGRILYTPAVLGSQLYADEGTPGRVWKYTPAPVIDRLYRAFLRQAIGNAAFWTVEAPETVYTTAYRLDDGFLLHFLNAGASVANTPGKPMPLENPSPAVPALEKDIIFTLTTERVSRATAFSNDFEGGKPLSVVPDGAGRWKVTLPAALLKVHCMVRVE